MAYLTGDGSSLTPSRLGGCGCGCGGSGACGQTVLGGCGCGCGGSGACGARGPARLGEIYIHEDDDRPPSPDDDGPSVGYYGGYGLGGYYGGYGLGRYGEAPATVSRPCPSPASTTTIRCQTPQACPAIPNRLCVTQVNGITFTYVGENRFLEQDPVTRLVRPSAIAPANRELRMVPDSLNAVSAFIANMVRFGMPIERIYTQGSHYCRCISGTNTLSNHSFGEAFDLAGVRWPEPIPVRSRVRDTMVENHGDVEQRRVLRRINACVRLSFTTVLDYNYNRDHFNHFHCDMNRGNARPDPRSRTGNRALTVFIQEALTHVTGNNVPSTGRFDAVTQTALKDYLGIPQASPLPANLDASLTRLFTQTAQTP